MSDEEVVKAYRRQMSRHHPDKLAGQRAAGVDARAREGATQQIQAAYELIRARRAACAKTRTACAMLTGSPRRSCRPISRAWATRSEAVVDAGADLVHFDVMDNHYVPNLTVGPVVCEALRRTASRAPIDVHLMVRPVDRLVPDFAAAGASYISFHPEASEHVDRTIQLIREHGCRPGLVFNPATPLDWLDYTLDKLDLVLLMSVNPGFGGQQFIPSALPKIAEVRRRVRTPAAGAIRLEVDGGIKVDNIARGGARPAPIPSWPGSAIFGSEDYAATIRRMRAAIASRQRESAALDAALPRRRSSSLISRRRAHARRARLPAGRAQRLGRHDHRPRLHLRPCIEDHDGLAGGAQQALVLEHLEHPAGHLARAADQARQLLAATP